MTSLDDLVPHPRLLEIDRVDVASPPDRIWALLRHGDLARSRVVRWLFALRAVPARLAGEPPGSGSLRLDDLTSSVARPGFSILVDRPPHEVALGAIGRVWQPDITFEHVDGADAFAAFMRPGFAKVAWAIRVAPLGARDTRVEVEVRVDTTDEESAAKFRRYFRLVGPASRFIRRSTLAALAREHGTPASHERDRAIAGDALLPDAAGEMTDGITIATPPDAIWPWLVQMGADRAGFYAIDALDNDGAPSAREVHPELQRLAVGDVLHATPGGKDGFEVLAIDPPRALVLGGLWDVDGKRQLPFASARPESYWHVTWAFELEALGDGSTRLHVRARAAFSDDERAHAAWIRPVHWLMERAQLRHLAARAEGRLARDGAHDVLEGIGGAARAALALLSPFARDARGHWGVDAETAARSFPGDELVASPAWGWTHGVAIDAPAERVWPWIAQIGADRGGFYSYQWLENVVGCGVRNAETIHPEWAMREGDALSLHPKMPPLRVVSVAPGRHVVAFAAPDATARDAGHPWASASWAFFVEPLGTSRCRVISRFRTACSDDVASRLASGPTLTEPIGFAMDRRMLLGVKERAERALVTER